MSIEPAIEIESLWKLYRMERMNSLPPAVRPRTARRFAEISDDRAVKEGRAFWALRDVNLTIARGESVGVIGRNGAGKSTLLKILSRVTAPTRGRVRLYGSLASLLEVGTGFHDELTGRENIALNATILGMSAGELARRFDAIVEFSGIGDFIDVPVKHLSSGMRVRLGFSVAVHVEPEILIVDEVLAVGDAEFQARCRDRVAEIVSAGERTVLVVSHSMADVERLCGRVVWLDHGTVMADGAAEETIQRYLSDFRDGPPRKQSVGGGLGSGSGHAIADGRGVWRLADRKDRSGNGAVKLTSLAFFDKAGHAVEMVGAGEPLILDIGYAATAAGRRKASINVAVGDERGNRVFWMPSRLVIGDDLDIAETGTFRCEVRELPLLPGNYSLDVWCNVEGAVADKLIGAAVLRVGRSNYYPSGKFPSSARSSVLVRYTWSDRPTFDQARPPANEAETEAASS
ncbi:MAG TPA: ABC transporter ATP-binding protein [Hyphomicrobiaceae bacterium]|nr:ABC transporter ATP-binding protein [Hyphomicrobiaceae bacterium]